MNHVDRTVLFLHSGDYDRCHQAFSIAATAAALGREVDLYFFWWALERLIRDDLDLPRAEAAGEAWRAVVERFEEGRFPTLRELLESARQTGRLKLFACSGSLALLGRRACDVEGKVDALVGWGAILDRTAGVADRFCL